MLADNTAHLKKAARRRHQQARQRATQALHDLQAKGAKLTVAGLAKAAGVARSWIYTQADLLHQIKASTQPSHTPASSPASDESWQRRLELAHQRIKELTDENAQLRTQLALAHGQRRADQITTSKTLSTTQMPRSDYVD
jgi:hypothetical protein